MNDETPMTMKMVKDRLNTTRAYLEQTTHIFDPKTIKRVMKILEADIWCQFWQIRREALLHNGILDKPNLEPLDESQDQ